MRIKIDPLDNLFSIIIRRRAKSQCQRCLRYKEFGDLQCAHCFGRRKKSVRWDMDNALGLCFTCHRIIDGEDPDAKKELFVKFLGEKGYKNLRIRAEISKNYDRKLIEMFLKKELLKYE